VVHPFTAIQLALGDLDLAQDLQVPGRRLIERLVANTSSVQSHAHTTSGPPPERPTAPSFGAGAVGDGEDLEGD